MTPDTIYAQPIHAPIVVPLGQITFTETFGRFSHDYCDDLRAELDASSEAEKIARSLGKPANTYWLARRNRLPVGYAELKYPSAPTGKPQRDVANSRKIYLLREFPGDGAGCVLIAPLLQAASRHAGSGSACCGRTSVPSVSTSHSVSRRSEMAPARSERNASFCIGW
jgi:hypothetical protein